MKMLPKNLMHLAILSVTLVVLILFIFLNYSFLGESPFKNYFHFNYISQAVVDRQDNIYIIDQSLKRLVKISRKNNTVQYIKNAKDSSKGIVVFSEIAVDRAGYLYVLVNTLDNQGSYIVSQQIKRYAPDGSMNKVLYNISYDQGKQPGRNNGSVKDLMVKGNYLYFYNLDQERVILNRVSLDGQKLDNEFNIALPDGTYLADLTGVQPGKIYLSTKKGDIYRIDQSYNFIPVYQGSQMNNTAPDKLDMDINGQLYFIDDENLKIDKLLTGENISVQTLLSEKILSKQGYNNFSLDFLSSLTVNDDGSIMAMNKHQLIFMDPRGVVNRVMEQAKYPFKLLLLKWLVWLALPMTIGVLIFTIRFIYIEMMQRKISLLIKQLVFVLLLILSMVTVAWRVYEKSSTQIDAEANSKLKLHSEAVAQLIDPQTIENITGPGDFMGVNYQAIHQRIDALINGPAWINGEEIYCSVYKWENQKLYYIFTADDNCSPYSHFPIQNNDYYKVVNQGEIITGKESDQDGNWVYAVAPIKNKDGKIIGAAETGLNKDGFEAHKRKMLGGIIATITIISAMIITLFVTMVFLLRKSIHTLLKGVKEYTGGNWDALIQIKSNKDEVEELGHAFNLMAQHNRDYITHITTLKDAYARFVPKGFLNLLGKETILEVEQGNQIKGEMAVLIVNIRDFYLMTENLAPEESFNLLNSFLGQIGSVIRHNDGLVDKYQGTGITAIFPGGSDVAVKTALDILNKIDHCNETGSFYDRRQLVAGLGLHQGNLMLGIVGEEKRMQSAVISDILHRAEVLERISFDLGSQALITKEIEQNLRNTYDYRFIGALAVDGREDLLKIYDLYQEDSPESRQKKQVTKKLFEEGVYLYMDGRFLDARVRFVEVLRQNPRDKAAQRYFFLSDEYYKRGAPEGWQGTIEGLT